MYAAELLKCIDYVIEISKKKVNNLPKTLSPFLLPAVDHVFLTSLHKSSSSSQTPVQPLLTSNDFVIKGDIIIFTDLKEKQLISKHMGITAVDIYFSQAVI